MSAEGREQVCSNPNCHLWPKPHPLTLSCPPEPGRERALVRVPAHEVVSGDRMGDGRWQGVQVVDVKYPVFERMAIGGFDPETVRISLGSHGWVGYRKDQPVLVERETPDA